MNVNIRKIVFVFIFLGVQTFSSWSQYQMEKLNRGVVAVRSGNNNFISWRWLGTEDDGITFNLYRNGTKVNANPLTVCNYQDNGAAANASYYVKSIVNGTEQATSETVSVWGAQYLKIPIQTPPGGTTPAGEAYTYNANDASVADLDGDGVYEIILKWDPSNAKDNSQSGYTGNTYVDAYRLDGTRIWRIDFGVNIRSGAHYMDFMVYDFDCDGKAEMMARTADGTKDGTGKIIGSATADYRSTAGYVLTGPEYFTVFNGLTGAAMATQNYWPARGTVSSWGDNYGNRVDRFKAGVAYLDGSKPSGIFFRGYYTRMTVAAWDWNGSTLSNRWNFDSGNSSSNAYYSQGAHSISIADVDDDGKHEIICGAAIIDDNGTGYFSTKYGHGDALHVSDMDPDLPGLEVFHIQEPVANQGMYMYNAKTKTVLWTKPTLQDGSQKEGPGRGVCADIDAAYKGAESWVSGGGIGGTYDCKGNQISTSVPSSCNFLVWWDGDLQRELLNNTMIDKYGTGRILTAYNMAPIASNNGTKSTPSLSGDIIGDWREEVIWRGSANDALYLFTTTTPSTYKFRTLMHDPQYRVAIAWQNTGYNQPPHLSYYLGGDMKTPVKPNIKIIGENTSTCSATITPSGSTSLCTGGKVTLTANSGTSYVWKNGSSQVATTATYVASTAGSYTVEVTNASGCKSVSSAVQVTVDAATPITPYAQIDGGAWASQSNASTCVGGSISFGPQPNVNTGWSWTGPNGFTASTRQIDLTALTIAQSGTYIANYNNGTCSVSANFSVIVNALPTATITASSTTFCSGAAVSLTSSAGQSYIWRNGTSQVATTAAYSANQAGSYTVEVTNSSGCKATSSPTQLTQTTPSIWYADTDADGFGDANSKIEACVQPNGYVANSTDKCPTDKNKTVPGNCGCGATEESCLDCNGTPNGSAKIDNCARCTGGTTQVIACTDKVEAELACAFDGVVESNNIGFSGTGFVNTTNVIGASFSFAVNALQAGNYVIGVRYATSSDRSASVWKNGTQIGTMQFVSSGTFTNYITEQITLNLNQGNNIIELQALTTGGLANVDLIYWLSPNLSKGDCSPTGLSKYAEGNFKVLPNPAADNLIIETKFEGEWIIYDALGIEVLKGKTNKINVADLVEGVYFIKVDNKLVKFVKQN